MGIDRQTSDDEIAHSFAVERLDDVNQVTCFHDEKNCPVPIQAARLKGPCSAKRRE
jgi:hypothetical protein